MQYDLKIQRAVQNNVTGICVCDVAGSHGGVGGTAGGRASAGRRAPSRLACAQTAVSENSTLTNNSELSSESKTFRVMYRMVFSVIFRMMFRAMVTTGFRTQSRLDVQRAHTANAHLTAPVDLVRRADELTRLTPCRQRRPPLILLLPLLLRVARIRQLHVPRQGRI
jgi:hypothetical protein